MAKTYEPIATTTISVATNGITFSSIPATYTDLVLVIYGKITGTSEDQYLRFNNDSSAIYQTLNGIGNTNNTPIVSSQLSETYIRLGDVWSNTWGMVKFDINGYSGSGQKRTLSHTFKQTNTADTKMTFGIGRWNSTSVINTVYIYNAGGTTGRYDVGTVATLYGILKA